MQYLGTGVSSGGKLVSLGNRVELTTTNRQTLLLPKAHRQYQGINATVKPHELSEDLKLRLNGPKLNTGWRPDRPLDFRLEMDRMFLNFSNSLASSQIDVVYSIAAGL